MNALRMTSSFRDSDEVLNTSPQVVSWNEVILHPASSAAANSPTVIEAAQVVPSRSACRLFPSSRLPIDNVRLDG